MTAIDFSELLRAEKQKAKKAIIIMKHTDIVSDPHQTKHSSFQIPQPLPEWQNIHNDTLTLKDDVSALAITCSDPPTIYYYQKPFRHNHPSQSPLQDWLQRIPSGDSGLEEWKTMTYGKRRVCMFGENNNNNNNNNSSNNGILPPPLSHIADQLVEKGIFPHHQRPNHVLLNEYQPSQGILPHTDGPLYASRTATISIGSDVVLEFTKRLTTDEIGTTQTENTTALNESHPLQVLLHANSLIVFEGEAYMDYCHSIAMDTHVDIIGHRCINAKEGERVERGLRYSLTFRHKNNNNNNNNNNYHQMKKDNTSIE